MRIRTALAGLLVAAGAAGCTDDPKQPSPYCQRLTAVGQRLSSAQQDLFEGGADRQASLARIVHELRGLHAGAPAEIRTSLAALATAFQRAEQALRHPTKSSQRQLAAAARVLSRDGKIVTDYVASKCDAES